MTNVSVLHSLPRSQATIERTAASLAVAVDHLGDYISHGPRNDNVVSAMKRVADGVLGLQLIPLDGVAEVNAHRLIEAAGNLGVKIDIRGGRPIHAELPDLSDIRASLGYDDAIVDMRLNGLREYSWRTAVDLRRSSLIESAGLATNGVHPAFGGFDEATRTRLSNGITEAAMRPDGEHLRLLRLSAASDRWT